MNNDLLVIVDMVNGFVNFGALADKRINRIVPNIENAIEWAKKSGIRIVAFKDCHEMGDEEFKTYPPHCLKGTSESDLIPELKKYEKDFLIINKNTTNGFKTDIFKNIVSKYEFRNVYVVGCCTDICVKDFSLSYKKYIDEKNLKTKIVVFKDMVSTFDSPVHKAEDAEEKTFKELQQKGIIIVGNLQKENVEKIK